MTQRRASAFAVVPFALATIASASYTAVPSAQACDSAVVSRELDAGVDGSRLWTPNGAPVVGGPFSVQVTHGPADGIGVLFFSAEQAVVPLELLGGSFFPGALLGTVPLTLGPSGNSSALGATGALSATLCGSELWAQAVLADPLAASGSSLSNGLHLLVGVPTAPLFPVGKYLAGSGPAGLATGDLNSDGHLDVVVANSEEYPDKGDVAILLGQGAGVLGEPDRYLVGTYWMSVELGDLDGDGDPDAVAVNNTGTFAVCLGAGDGTFEKVTRYARPVGLDVELADMDGDGILDAVALSAPQGSTAILLGNGDGSFKDAAIYGVAAGSPGQLNVGDFNSDGLQDVALANASPPAVSVLLGIGHGALGYEQIYHSGGALWDVESGDFDSDGTLDLAVAGATSEVVRTMKGAGNGSFAVHTAFEVDSTPGGIAVGDIDANGTLDLAVLTSSTTDIWLGDGDGEFGRDTTYETGHHQRIVTLADMDGDGPLDLVTAIDEAAFGWTFDAVNVLLGKGDGTFPGHRSFDVGLYVDALASGDFDSDGKPDLAALQWAAGDMHIAFGDGTGALSEPQPVFSALTVRAVAVGDIDGDERLDLAVSFAEFDGFAAGVAILLGQGDGTFVTGGVVGEDGTPALVRLADLDGDGATDLLVSDPQLAGLHSIVIYPGTGAGLFGSPTTFDIQTAAELNGLRSFSLSDMNSDNVLDLVVVHGSNWITVFPGDGEGSFGQPWPSVHPSISVEAGPALADFDGDGTLDVAVTGSDRVGVLLATGAGALSDPLIIDVVSLPEALAAADFNGDGHVDLALGTNDSEDIVVLPGHGDGTFGPQARFESGGSRALLAIDMDLDGNIDLAVGSAQRVSLLLNQLGE